MFSLKEASCHAEASTGLPAGQGGMEFYPQWPELSLRSGVVPFRLDIGDRLEFLLIRRSGHAWWSLPKGRLTPGHTLAHSAEVEAFEEAGIRGAIGSAPLGSYQYRKTARGIMDPPRLVELVLFSLIPLMAVLLLPVGVFFFRERLSPLNLVGFVFCVVGVILVGRK